jgi:hypothetical protein
MRYDATIHTSGPGRLVVFPLCVVLCLSAAAVAQPGLWFDDQHPANLNEQDMRQLGQIAHVYAFGGEPIQISDRLPRLVIVSVSDGQTPARLAVGSGHGWNAAVRQAIDSLRPLNGMQWLRLDVITAVRPAGPMRHVWLEDWATRRDGLAFDRESRLVLLADELFARGLVDEHDRWQPRRTAAYIQHDAIRAAAFDRIRDFDGVDAYRFDTRHVLVDAAGPRTINWRDAAAFGGMYLAQAVNEQGRFTYQFDPRTTLVPPKYNMLRHSGSIYAMLELYRVTHDADLLAAVERAIDYLLRQVRDLSVGEQRVKVVEERGDVKIGGNALAILALVEYQHATGDDRHLPLARMLAQYLVATQADDGHFLIHKLLVPEGRDSGFVSEYYPGEAIFALMRLYGIDNDPRWLRCAAANADYLIDIRDAGKPVEELLPDHWLLYGLDVLHRARPDDRYLTHAIKVSRAVRLDQHDAGPWIGGFFDPARSTPTATRVEGLVAAHRLLRDFGHADEAAQIAEAIDRGAAFVQRCQIGPDLAMFYPMPQRTLGGVTASLDDPMIRIDFVQHAISAWLGAADILDPP